MTWEHILVYGLGYYFIVRPLVNKFMGWGKKEKPLTQDDLK